jgi:hypothetical protein
MLLKSRRECLGYEDQSDWLAYSFSASNQIRSKLDPDPLHFPDERHETPLTIAVNHEEMNHKRRMDIISMLMEAGATGDVDVYRESRLMDARKYTPGVLPPCYGIITCCLFHEFVVYLSIHKDSYCVEMRVDLKVLLFSVDHMESILPPNFDFDKLWMSCHNQRFDFAASVDGLDFDIHFDVMDTARGDILVVGCEEGATYKLSIRFPRGPFETGEWIDTVEESYVFSYSTSVYKGYTLAHHAVMCPNVHLRDLIVGAASSICNPLVKCYDGLTATQTLENALQGMTSTSNIRMLLRSMQLNQDWMSTYVHKDCDLLGHYNKHMKRVVNSRSPFHRLGEDLQRHILSFV